MDDKDLPELSWQEVHASFMQNTPNHPLLALCRFDVGALPMEDLGSRYSGAKLVDAIMERYPAPIMLSDGRAVQWECMEQRDLNANRLTGGLGHPFSIIGPAVERMRQRWEWCDGHIAVLQPTLFAGHMHLKSKDGIVNGQCATLPPIECMGVLRSGPMRDGDYASAVAVLWYQTGFDIDSQAIRQIENLNWTEYAYSWDF